MIVCTRDQALASQFFDVLLQFRFHRIALAGDIEKAFVMVLVQEKDRDSLRFLWTRDVNRETPDVIVLRFTRVVFGVNSSPLLLNATIEHHMRKYQEIDPSFMTNFFPQSMSMTSASAQTMWSLPMSFT